MSDLSMNTSLYERGRNVKRNGPALVSYISDCMDKGWWKEVITATGVVYCHDTFTDYLTHDFPGGPEIDLVELGAHFRVLPVAAKIIDTLFSRLEAEGYPVRDEISIREREVSKAKGAVREDGDKSCYNITPSSNDRGTTAEYTIRRLLKEGKQDLVDLVVAGELSANAAAIEAGFRPKSKTFSETMDISKVIANLNDLYQPGFIQALKEAL